jgi:hypothetical protein
MNTTDPARVPHDSSARTRWAGGLLAAAVLALVPAVATAALDESTTSTTAISGYSGFASESFTLDLGTEGLQEIAWQEGWDQPCYFRIAGKDPDDASETDARTENFCDGGLTAYSQKTVDFEDNPRYFVRGISVCNNNNANKRLKGIKIYASRLPVGSDDVEVLAVSDMKDRANCDIWQPAVYCPSGKVASGLEVRVKDGSAVGLGLVCKARD